MGWMAYGNGLSWPKSGELWLRCSDAKCLLKCCGKDVCQLERFKKKYTVRFRVGAGDRVLSLWGMWIGNCPMTAHFPDLFCCACDQ